ncbi:ABC transporter substrate-binding protein [Embleya hyalina]|uniref:ABC transporter substrate-binding protein n=1 Tax=Embleya hyalina TaxID=516124 RepID=A0A401Z674_9ACTN|nr:ABC transporter substrate-binding protein [Embleya hyalina]
MLVATACGSPGRQTPDSWSTPGRGGVLRVAVPTDPPSLDPFTTPSYAVAYGHLLAAIYDPLVWADPATGAIRPHIAESLTPSPDARTWTLVIRPGVVFSDGLPFDAAAVKANWRVHADPATGSAGAIAATGLKLTVADPLRLTIELPGPNAHFDRAVANNLAYVASPRALNDLVSLRTEPVGAGPFVLAERVPGRRLTLRRNPHYWQPGRPYLDQVEVHVPSVGKTQVESMAAEDFDLTTVGDPAQVKEATAEKLGVLPIQLGGGRMLVFNTRRPPFNDPAARRAVVNSLSADEIDRRFFRGAGTPAHGIFGSTSQLANGRLAARDDDPEAARAGFDKLTAGGSRPFDFTFVAVGVEDPGSQASYIRAQVQRFPGVHMRIDTVDTATLIRRSISGDFDMAVTGLWMSDPEPVLYDFLRPGSLTNISGYSNATVTEAMNAGRLATNPVARRDAYTRVQVRLNEDLPFWVYQEAANTVVFAPSVTGIQPHGDGLVLFDRIGLRR